jgi:hypothetical protein
MKKYPFNGKCLAIGIILLFVSTSNIPGSAQIRSVITNTSTSEDLPDLTIVDVIGEISMDGPDLICVVKNIGTAPSAEYHLQADEYVLFGLLHVNHLDCYGFPFIKAGETENIELGCPQPFIGILRLRCYISTTIPEANYNNNRFTHSYFIVNMFPFWSIKKLPF